MLTGCSKQWVSKEIFLVNVKLQYLLTKNCEETLLCGMVKMQTTMPDVAADFWFNILYIFAKISRLPYPVGKSSTIDGCISPSVSYSISILETSEFHFYSV